MISYLEMSLILPVEFRCALVVIAIATEKATRIKYLYFALIHIVAEENIITPKQFLGGSIYFLCVAVSPDIYLLVSISLPSKNGHVTRNIPSTVPSLSKATHLTLFLQQQIT